jgi:hypothetical protein
MALVVRQSTTLLGRTRKVPTTFECNGFEGFDEGCGNQRDLKFQQHGHFEIRDGTNLQTLSKEVEQEEDESLVVTVRVHSYELVIWRRSRVRRPFGLNSTGLLPLSCRLLTFCSAWPKDLALLSNQVGCTAFACIWSRVVLCRVHGLALSPLGGRSVVEQLEEYYFSVTLDVVFT